MSDKNIIEWVRYSFPQPDHPCYRLTAAVRVDQDRDWKVEEVRVNGKRVRDCWVYNDGEYHKLRVLRRGALAWVVVRCDWVAGRSYTLELSLKEDDGSRTASLKCDSTAAGEGGYWNPAWKYYMGVVARENTGLARTKEPIHVTLATYADRIADPEREVRVVEVDPLSGVQTEIPSQTYHVSTWTTPKPDKYCQNTTTCEVAFLADVPAFAEKVFLVFYGNPGAPQPVYQTDLAVSGQGLELNIENSHYRMHTQSGGGAIDEIAMKMGINALFEHRLETNGAVQWNPDCYSPKRPWTHSADWNPPAHCAEVRGPIFLMTKRSGILPEYPEIELSVTYLLYAHNPYLMFSSTIDVIDDLHVIALRNGEFVFNHAVFKEFAWKKPDGGIGNMVIKDGPRHPRHALRLEPDTPWMAYYSREHGCGFGAMTLNLSEMRRVEGMPRKDYPFIYLAWGPWTYFSRVYTYAFGSNNPQRMVKVGKGATYYEQMAFTPFQLGRTDEDCFDQLEEWYVRLSDPLDVRVDLDTDDRVPEEWVPPILTADFEEMEDAEE
jgi:hypothetical protein